MRCFSSLVAAFTIVLVNTKAPADSQPPQRDQGPHALSAPTASGGEELSAPVPQSVIRDLSGDMMDLVSQSPLEGQESGGVRQLAPIAGTSQYPIDFAQQTLNEDWFLEPGFGNAVLHLDVPYYADVEVHRARGDAVTSVRSRGRYRHLVLRHVPRGTRETVHVKAFLRSESVPCDQEDQEPICVQVQVQAGDRRFVRVLGNDAQE